MRKRVFNSFSDKKVNRSSFSMHIPNDFITQRKSWSYRFPKVGAFLFSDKIRKRKKFGKVARETSPMTEKKIKRPFQCICLTIPTLSPCPGVRGSPKRERFCSLAFDREASWGSSSGKQLQWQKRQSIFLSNKYS